MHALQPGERRHFASFAQQAVRRQDFSIHGPADATPARLRGKLASKKYHTALSSTTCRPITSSALRHPGSHRWLMAAGKGDPTPPELQSSGGLSPQVLATPQKPTTAKALVSKLGHPIVHTVRSSANHQGVLPPAGLPCRHCLLQCVQTRATRALEHDPQPRSPPSCLPACHTPSVLSVAARLLEGLLVEPRLQSRNLITIVKPDTHRAQGPQDQLCQPPVLAQTSRPQRHQQKQVGKLCWCCSAANHAMHRVQWPQVHLLCACHACFIATCPPI